MENAGVIGRNALAFFALRPLGAVLRGTLRAKKEFNRGVRKGFGEFAEHSVRTTVQVHATIVFSEDEHRLGALL